MASRNNEFGSADQPNSHSQQGAKNNGLAGSDAADAFDDGVPVVDFAILRVDNVLYIFQLVRYRYPDFPSIFPYREAMI